MTHPNSGVRARALILLVAVVLAAAGCRTPQPLVEPPPIAAAPSTAQTRTAILRALQVVVRYVSSEGLEYADEDGTRVIHRGYNQRVERLAQGIGTEIQIARAESDLHAVAAPPPGSAGTQ